MYKIILLALAINGIAIETFSQNNNSTDIFLEEKNSINKNGMYVLGGWALLNIVSGTVGNYTTKGKTKYFHQFNALWNSVNLGIAVFGLNGISDDSLSLSQSFSEFNNLQNILLLNAGLDIAYITAGFYLKEKSKTAKSKNDLLFGYGNSLILQGAFLLAFDLVLYFLHNQNAEINLLPLIDFANSNYLGVQLKIKL